MHGEEGARGGIAVPREPKVMALTVSGLGQDCVNHDTAAAVNFLSAGSSEIQLVFGSDPRQFEEWKREVQKLLNSLDYHHTWREVRNEEAGHTVVTLRRW